MKTKKRIIIFGATGKTGPYVVDYALNYFNKSEYEIIASGRRKTRIFSKLGVPYYSIDISKKEDFNQLPKDNVYAVVLLAAQLPTKEDAHNQQNFIDTNITGALNVLEYCRNNKVDRIIYTQTVFDISLYPHDVILKPDLPQKFSYSGDHAMYVISKNTAIEFIKHYHQEYGLKYFIFRLPTIYCCTPFRNLYQDRVKKVRPIYQMIEKAKAGKPLEIWGDPNYSKDMVYVKDFSQMICKGIEVDRKKGLYNVGTGDPVTLEKQIRTIVDVFSPTGRKSKITYRQDKESSGGFLMDITKAKKELGYDPKYDCRKLFEDFKKEMELDRFKELNMMNI